ncbi:unnamed protein product, partial [Laminaria digitata]
PSTKVCSILGSNWEQTMHPDLSKRLTDKAKANVFKTQRKMGEYVKTEVTAEGTPKYKGNAFITLVFGYALKGDAHIIEVMMNRLRAEDAASSATDATEGEDGMVDLSGRTTGECLAQLFGLMESTQHDDDLCDMVRRFGLTNKTKKLAVELG